MNIKKIYVVPFLSLLCLSLGSWSFTASSFDPSSATDSHTL